MKTVLIPRGETISYETLSTENLVVKGRLVVTGDLRAKHISGGGTLSAETIRADSICVDELECAVVTCKRLIAKRVSAPEVFASESALVSCYLAAAYVETPKLTVAISEINEVKAEQVINLTNKKRTLFFTMLASAVQSFFTVVFAPRPKKERSKASAKAEGDAVERTAEASDAALQAETDTKSEASQVVDPFAKEDTAKEESEDFELKRIVALFKLSRESGYTLRLIPGTPEENAPVLDFEDEETLRAA